MHLSRGELKAAGLEIESAARFAPCALFGPAWLQWKAAAAVQWAILWLYMGYFSDRLYYRAFRAMWNGQIRRGRIDAVAAQRQETQLSVYANPIIAAAHGRCR